MFSVKYYVCKFTGLITLFTQKDLQQNHCMIALVSVCHLVLHLLQNARVMSDFSLLPNITLDRALGPFVYGRYKRVGTQCIFQHHRTEERNRTANQVHVSRKLTRILQCLVRYTDDSFIDGIYTYNNLSESIPVYAKQVSNRFRYMYHIHIGWTIKG